MNHLRPPDDYPPISLMGAKPLPLSASERWEVHLELARERRERVEALDMSKENGGNDED
jgi:hypothetical protein